MNLKKNPKTVSSEGSRSQEHEASTKAKSLLIGYSFMRDKSKISPMNKVDFIIGKIIIPKSMPLMVEFE